MKPLAFVLLGTFLFSGSLSCGGGGGVSSTGIPEEEACSQAAVTFCKKIYACQDSSSLLVQAVLMTEATCETTILQNCGSTAFHCADNATYHPDQALACKNGFNAQDCAKLGATILASVSMMSTSAAVAAITANVPACTTVCSVP